MWSGWSNLSGTAFRPVILIICHYTVTITSIYGRKLLIYFRTREKACYHHVSLWYEGEGH